eukprot:Em0005g224a
MSEEEKPVPRVCRQRQAAAFLARQPIVVVHTEVRDLILNPPTSRPYTEVRTELIQGTAVSQRYQLQQLLSGEELGDQTPRLLRQMERLLGDNTEQANGPLFRELFLQRLPANVRMVLVSLARTFSLKELADREDEQCIGDAWHPIAYFSRKLKPAEVRYSAFDKELLAMCLAVKHFRHFVEGRVFHLLNDHKPLTFALASNSASYTPRQARHLDFISQFTSDVRHVKGEDALSRFTVDALVLKGIDGVPRPLVPSALRRHVFDVLHSLAHPGIRATQRLIVARFIWPNIHIDVRNWARTCLQCQRSKLKAAMQTLRATSPRQNQGHKLYRPSDLPSSTHVFVRHDAIQPPLQQPYDAIQPPLQQPNDAIQPPLQQPYDAIQPPLQQPYDAIQPPLQQPYDAIQPPLQQPYDAIQPPLQQPYDAIQPPLQQPYDAIQPPLQQPYDAIQPPLQQPYDAIQPPLQQPYDAIQPPLQQPYDAIQPPLQQPYDAIQPPLQKPYDAIQPPLQQPYDGPFKVLHRTDKHFTLDINGRKEVITIDRLKSAHVEETPHDPAILFPPHKPVPPAVTVTRHYFEEMLDQWLKWAPPNRKYPCTEDLVAALGR